MKTPLNKYIAEIEQALKDGNATEHTYRPALKNLIEASDTGITATNEPKREECGAPDFVVSKNTKHGPLTIGYIEAKDVVVSLDDADRTDQLKRYFRHLPNLILTNYIEFRWYVEGELRESARLARIGKDGKLKPEKEDLDAVEALLKDFLSHEPEPVAKPLILAQRMARITHMIRDIVIETFDKNRATAMLRDLRKAFADTLIPDIEMPEKTVEFADMYAQTIAYGLFAARCNHQGNSAFQRLGAAGEIPKTNPFLRKLFGVLTGPDLGDEPYAGFVDDLVGLLASTDIGAVLENFGKRTRLEDPVVHFYETFLATYDPKLREMRGVYYTPEPVVSYIVRSVDHILKERFGCPDGLADNSKIKYERADEKGKKEKAESHRVLILDPACGTGTFLYTVVDFIREQYMRRGDAGMWSGYVRNHLLPRLFGFELLMAPYAVAHFKLAMQFAAQDLNEPLRKSWAYDFESQERLSIYLTNTLEEAERITKQLGLFERFIAEEANAAAQIKKDLPIMVILGNPPYSGHSANRSWEMKGDKKVRTFIGELLNGYYFVDGKPLGERNPKWLQDDYVKFIRWAQWKIERTGAGVLAFISNHSYLDNPTFRGMRQQLMSAFNEIYILDLHGNAKKKQKSPDGSKEENVFDIQQGVAIGIFIKDPSVKKKKYAAVRHIDMWGTRTAKYRRLKETDVKKTKWNKLNPQQPFYLFIPQASELIEEYSNGWNITEIMPINSVGITTARDNFVIDFGEKALLNRMEEFKDMRISDNEIRNKYFSQKTSVKYLNGDTRGWNLSSAREKVRMDKEWKKRAATCLYRPFDTRFIYYVDWMVDWPRTKVMRQLQVGENIAICLTRSIEIGRGFEHVFCTRKLIQHHSVSLKEVNYLLPLYLYPDPDRNGDLFSNGSERHVNLNPRFISDFEKRLKLKFVSESKIITKKTFGPEDVFNYIYAVFHSPVYRKRYAESLKNDFPRVPLTSDVDLFHELCANGKELVGLHLLESAKLSKYVTRYPIAGDNLVEKGHPRYLAPGDTEPGSGKPLKAGRIYISKDDPKQGKKGQYFEGVSQEVWEFHIGGYQVCEKWLKDRRDRKLSYEDLTHYQNIVVAIKETIRLMNEIDKVIKAHGGWPLSGG